MAKDQKNVLRLRRGRTVGLGLIVIMGFLLFGFVFLVDEPTQIVIVPDDPQTPENEEIVIELPPIGDIIDLEVPIPTFEARTVSITPVITLIDDLGNMDVTRGETTFLTSFTGFEITKAGTDATYDNGRLMIDLEFDTDTTDPLILRGSYLLEVDPHGLFVRTLLPPTGTVNGLATIEIYSSRIDQIVTMDGENKLGFTLTSLNLDVQQDVVEAPLLSPIIIPEFTLLDPVIIYNVTFNNAQTIMVEEQIVNGSDIVIVEEVTEDTPFVPCPLPVKDDSISILFPSIGVSGTSALWDKILIDDKLHDIINVDIRNNRNCDLTLAVGSQWQRVTGEIFRSDIETFIVPTNSTQPFSSIPFDGSVDCGTPAGNCAGLEIQWCFIAKATVDDVTEIVDPFCGKKFYR